VDVPRSRASPRPTRPKIRELSSTPASVHSFFCCELRRGSGPYSRRAVPKDELGNFRPVLKLFWLRGSCLGEAMERAHRTTSVLSGLPCHVIKRSPQSVPSRGSPTCTHIEYDHPRHSSSHDSFPVLRSRRALLVL
jgi:hypothetical protein